MKIEQALRIAAEARIGPRRNLGADPAAAGRDARGHYLKGSAGGPGRPKGSANRLGKAFVDDLLHEWQKYGRRTLLRLSKQDPVAYVKIMAGIARVLCDRDEGRRPYGKRRSGTV
jgi:hypothetical protein